MKVGDKKFICENGRWRISTVLHLGDGIIKRCNKRWFDTKAEAREWYMDWETEQFNSKDIVGGSMKMVKFLQEWRKHRDTEIGETTAFTSDNSYLKVFFEPYIDEKMSVLDFFSQSNVMKIRDGIYSHDCGIKRKNGAIALFQNMLEYAYNLMYIGDKEHQTAKVRMEKIKATREAKKEMPEREPWSIDEESKFIAVCGTNTFEGLMFGIFLKVGMRLGEFLALKPKDIDLENGFVNVTHQFVYNGSGKAIDTNILKSQNSYRKMPIGEDTKKEIVELVELEGIGENEYMFPISKVSFRRYWDRAIAKAGIRKMIPHGTRHMVATRMLGNCQNLHDQTLVSKCLGHTPSVDLNTYASHATEDEMKALFGK